MPKTIIFSDSITDDTVPALIEKLDEPFDIFYFCSWGGQLTAGELLLDYLNRKQPEMTCFGMIGSKSFDVVFKYHKVRKVRLVKGCCGAVHLPQHEYGSRELLRGDGHEKFFAGLIKEEGLQMIRDYTFLTDEEVNLFTKGFDVYISPERLKKIFYDTD